MSNIWRVGGWSLFHRRLVLGAWVVIALGPLLLASAVGSRSTNSNVIPGTESQRAADELRRAYPAAAGDVDQIVVQARGSLITRPSERQAVEAMLAKVARLPHVVSVENPYASSGQSAIARNQRVAFATVMFDRRAADLSSSAIKGVIATAQAARSPRLEVELGGAAIEQVQTPKLGLSTLVGILAAVIVLLLAFGSVVAMGLPIITALLGLGSAFGMIGVLSHAVSMPSAASEFAAMIGLGVGIDYALFIVTRFRENRGAGLPSAEAIGGAMDTAGRAVVFAGATVIVALLGMLALGVTFLTGMAVASAVAVLLMVLAAASLMPALLGMFGERISRRRRPRTERSLWGRWARFVSRRPWSALASGLAIMLVLAIPALSMRLAVSDAANDPSSQTTYKAYELLAGAFGPGFNGPLEIVAQLPHPDSTGALSSITHALDRTGGVASVVGPELGPARTTALWRVYPSSSPQSRATTDVVNVLRRQVLPGVARHSDARILVGGVTATGIDFTHVLGDKLAPFIAIVVVLGALLLLVAFRSLLVPVHAALLNLLSVGAALGVTVAIFQYGWLGGITGLLPGPIDPWLPVMVFAVVFGLSMDYEVFLVSRIREQFTHHREPGRAVTEGMASTGRLITAAATIMVCVFLSFGIAPGRQIKLFGLSLASAVFLDAFVIRSLILPASLQLLGRRTWQLPAPLGRRLPTLTIEPPKPVPVTEEP